MVRLKVFMSADLLPTEDGFQFHNGSIKSGRVILNLSIIPWFQFHNGSIKSEQYWVKIAVVSGVSIPQWFD